MTRRKAGRAIRYNLSFFKEKNERISTTIPHAAFRSQGTF